MAQAFNWRTRDGVPWGPGILLSLLLPEHLSWALVDIDRNSPPPEPHSPRKKPLSHPPHNYHCQDRNPVLANTQEREEGS